MTRTNRTFTNAKTGKEYILFTSQDASKDHLITEEGEHAQRFYATAYEQTIKLNTGKVISLEAGTFYELKDGEKVTHRRIAGRNKFTKV